MYNPPTITLNDIILTALQHLFQDKYISDNIHDICNVLLCSVIEDIEHLLGNLNRSIRCDAMKHDTDYDSVYRDKLMVKLIDYIKAIELEFKHRSDHISKIIYDTLNGRLSDIIKCSTIEHDISMAYLLKLIIKEILVKGTAKADNKGIPYSYTWMDKLIAFCYICGHIRYIEAATARIMHSNYAFKQSVNLISSLNHVRQLVARKTLMEIINDSLYG